MKLSIIITQYKESLENCLNNFRVLNLQQNINYDDYEIIIVNDFGVPLNQDDVKTYLSNYKNIQFINKETNTGPGDARNHGIDKATGDYITFFDSEDFYQNLFVLSFFETIIHTNIDKNDVTFSQWVNPIKMNGQWVYPVNQVAPSWIFGIFYRRAFLDLHKIRFLPYKIWNEEHYFNQKILTLTDKVAQVPYLTYVWNHNLDDPTSITTKDGQSYSYRILPSWVKVWHETHKWKYNISKLQNGEVFNILVQAFFMIHNWEFLNPRAKPYLIQAENNISLYYKEFQHMIEKVSEEEKSNIYKSSAGSSNKIPNVSFDSWINKISKMEATEQNLLL